MSKRKMSKKQIEQAKRLISYVHDIIRARHMNDKDEYEIAIAQIRNEVKEND